MLIDLGEEIKITVKVGEKSYQLREPRQVDIENFQAQSEDPHAFSNFVEILGMPRDAINELGVLRLQKLAAGLTGALTEKK